LLSLYKIHRTDFASATTVNEGQRQLVAGGDSRHVGIWLHMQLWYSSMRELRSMKPIITVTCFRDNSCCLPHHTPGLWRVHLSDKTVFYRIVCANIFDLMFHNVVYRHV